MVRRHKFLLAPCTLPSTPTPDAGRFELCSCKKIKSALYLLPFSPSCLPGVSKVSQLGPTALEFVFCSRRGLAPPSGARSRHELCTKKICPCNPALPLPPTRAAAGFQGNQTTARLRGTELASWRDQFRGVIHSDREASRSGSPAGDQLTHKRTGSLADSQLLSSKGLCQMSPDSCSY